MEVCESAEIEIAYSVVGLWLMIVDSRVVSRQSSLALGCCRVAELPNTV